MQESSSQILIVRRHLVLVLCLCLFDSYAVSQLAAASLAQATVEVGPKGSIENGATNSELMRVEGPLSAAVLDAGGTSDRWGVASTSAKASAVGSPGNQNFWKLKAAAAAGVIYTDNALSNGIGDRALAGSNWQDEVFFQDYSCISFCIATCPENELQSNGQYEPGPDQRIA